MEEQIFRQATQKLASGGKAELENYLNSIGVSIIDYSRYAMAYPSWADGRFNEIHYKQLTAQDFDAKNLFEWKLTKNLTSFDALITHWESGEPYTSLVSSYILNNLNTYGDSQKRQLEERGIINSNSIFKNDLKNGVIPFYTFHQYKEDSAKYQLIQEHIEFKIGLRAIPYEELKYFYEYKLIPENKINDYCLVNGIKSPVPVPNEMVAIPNDLWTNPVVMLNRTDCVLIGNTQAGKTMFLASLIKYCESIGNLSYNTMNNKGSVYGNILTNAITNGRLINYTPPEEFLTLALDFRIEVSSKNLWGRNQTIVKAPINLIELSGEAFKRTFSSYDESGIPTNIREAIFNTNNNPKVYIFTIPVNEQEIMIQTSSGPMSVNAQGFYNFFIDYLQKIGKMKEVVALALVFTKWDLYRDGDKHHFLNERCLNLKNTLQNLVNQNKNIKAAYFTHSLGKVNDTNRSYTYDSADMAEIYNWLMQVIPYQK